MSYFCHQFLQMEICLAMLVIDTEKMNLKQKMIGNNMVNHLMSILLIMPFLIVILLKLIQKLTLTMYYKRFILDYKLNKKSIIEEYFISPIFLMQLVVLMVSCNNFGECYSQVFLRLAQLMVLSVKCIELKVKINHYILIQMEIRNKMEMFA